MKHNSLKELCLHELKDLHEAETQLLEALPALAVAAHSQDLKAAFESHLLETREHVRRLEESLRSLGGSPGGEKCEGMAGLLAEAARISAMEMAADLKDTALMSAAQRVEHYEIAAYSSVISYCGQLGESEVARVLEVTLKEEKATSSKLTELAAALTGGDDANNYGSGAPDVFLTGAEDHTPLEGLRVLVTGGTTGIGRAIALRLAAEGARVMIFGRNKTHLEDALQDLRKISQDVMGTTADASKASDMEGIFRQIDRDWKGLDVLVANAAVGAAGVAETSDQEREYALLTNISGYLRCCRLAVPRLKQGGQIVLIGSISADEQNPGSSIYVATKSAIQGFAESFRQEMAEDGIRVSLVEPGKTGSDLIDADLEEQRKLEQENRMMKAEDVGAAVAFVLTQSPRVTISNLKLQPAKPGA